MLKNNKYFKSFKNITNKSWVWQNIFYEYKEWNQNKAIYSERKKKMNNEMIFMNIIIFPILLYFIGVFVNMSIFVYYDLFTNRNKSKVSLFEELYIFLSFFKTKKILENNKKYSFCKKTTIKSIIGISIIATIGYLIYLNYLGIIDINFILNPIIETIKLIENNLYKIMFGFVGIIIFLTLILIVMKIIIIKTKNKYQNNDSN